MLSRSNDIRTDIARLHGNSLTPEMEDAISVLEAYRPRVEIDRVYQDRLKAQLLHREPKRRIYLSYAWLSWGASACAALIMVVGVLRLVTPSVTPLVPEESVSGLPLANHVGVTHDTIVTPVSSGDSLTREVPTAKVVPRVVPTEAPDTSVAMIPPSASDALQSDMGTYALTSLAPGSTPVTMDMARGGAENAMLTSLSPVSVDLGMDDSVESEISDMVYEINSIIHESPQRIESTLPDYPSRMTIYTKMSAFTPSERTSLTGADIVSTDMPTRDPATMRDLITQTLGDATVDGVPELIYIEYTEGGRYTLAPVWRYRVGTRTLDIPLIAP